MYTGALPDVMWTSFSSSSTVFSCLRVEVISTVVPRYLLKRPASMRFMSSRVLHSVSSLQGDVTSHRLLWYLLHEVYRSVIPQPSKYRILNLLEALPRSLQITRGIIVQPLRMLVNIQLPLVPAHILPLHYVLPQYLCYALRMFNSLGCFDGT